MTTASATSRRTRSVVALVAVIWGVIFFHGFTHASWVPAIVLAALAGLFYLVEPRTSRQRGLLAIVVAAFGGLGALWIVGLGSWSILAAIVGAAGFLLYCSLDDRRVG